jgi:hypothetical protein
MITWKVTKLEVKPAEGQYTDVVAAVSWICSASQDGKTAQTNGETGLPPVQGDFVPFGNLTQDEVLSWCYANGLDKEAAELRATQKLQDLLTPPTVSKPVPWASVA